MTSSDVHGKFLWHELLTTDPHAAGAFYSRVLGWRSQAWDKDPSYTVLSNAKGAVGGMMKLSGEGSPHWLAYIGVPDVDTTAAAVQRLGGRVVKPAAQIPDGGRYAVLADPQGGVFGVYTPTASSGSASPTDEFAWHELATAEHMAAFRFYRELFGWEQLALHDMGPAGPYLIFGRHGQRLGGMFNRPSSMVSSWPHWLVYARVPSAARAAEATTAAGGRVANGPHEVPDGSWIAQLTDPQGAAIAVNQLQAPSGAVAKPAAASAVSPSVRPPAAAPKPAALAPSAVAPRPAAVAPSAVAPRPAAPTASAPRHPNPATAPAARAGAPAVVAPSKPAVSAPPKPAPSASPRPSAPASAGPAPRAKPKRAKPKRAKKAKKAKKAKRVVRKKAVRAKSKGRLARRSTRTRRSAGRRRRKAAKRPARKVARRKKSGRRARRARR